VDLLHRAQGPGIVTGNRRWRGLLGLGYAHIKPGKPNNMMFAFAPTR